MPFLHYSISEAIQQPPFHIQFYQVDPLIREAEAVNAIWQEFRQRLDQLEALLNTADGLRQSSPEDTIHPGYCVGGRLSLADASFGSLFLYSELVFVALGITVDASEWAAQWPRVRLLRDALAADPAIMKDMDVLQPAANGWLDGKLNGAKVSPCSRL
jgi:glutathione S-transferase